MRERHWLRYEQRFEMAVVKIHRDILRDNFTIWSLLEFPSQRIPYLVHSSLKILHCGGKRHKLAETPQTSVT